jgi:hypothetical protein
MGGVVSDIGSGLSSAISGVGSGLVNEIGNLGFQGGGGILGGIEKGITNTVGGVSNALANIDDAIPQEAKIAAAIYLASQGMPVGAEGGILSGANAAVAADNAYLASQAAGIGAIATPVATGSIIASELPSLGAATGTGASTSALAPSTYNEVLSQLTQYPTTIAPAESSFLSGMTAENALSGAGVAGTGISSGVGASTGLSGLASSALNWATANPLQAAALGLTASKALGGSTPTSSTATTNIDPEVKAAYLRNLEEARATAAGLAPKQFAPYAEYNLGMVQQYMNPYENQVVQNAMADIERQRQGQISAEGAAATAAKAFGGTRQAVTRSLVDEAALRNAGNLAAQLRQTGFAQAQNLGLSQQQLKQQYEQQKLDAARNLGLERLNVAQGALSLQPANIGGSTTTPIYQNQAASALGGALGGATLGKLIGGTANPEYAGYGAAAGGLLGFL